MRMEYFCCYNSYRKKVAKLSDQEVGRLFRSLMLYNETGETQELTGRESVAFDFIADDIDRAAKNYEAKCEKNRANRSGANDRQRSSTNVNDRQRSSTNVNERHQYKDKDENEDENKDKSIGGMVSPYDPLSSFLPPRTRELFAKWLGVRKQMGKPCEGAELDEMLKRTKDFFDRFGEKMANDALGVYAGCRTEKIFEPKRK